MGLLRQPNVYPACFLLLLFIEPIHATSPSAAIWTGAAILIASMMIAWAAESSQYFIAQGFALAILAWMQTLPEFAVEAVLAWHREIPLLLANLTGALRLLTGVGWPMIYFTAAFLHRRKYKTALNTIHLEGHHSVEVMGLLVPLIYVAVIAAKGTLSLIDAGVLIAIYAGYLVLLSRMPTEDAENIEDLETIPRAIVTAPRLQRIAMISILFAGGALLIRYSAAPFLSSLLAVAVAVGIPSFRAIQWIAPLVSEFPEMASTFYFARRVESAPMALMNMVSSNINQWTLLIAMLPVVLSFSSGHLASIPLDSQQEIELLLTLGQAVLGMTFLLNMKLDWWEAAALAVLFAVPLLYSRATAVVTIIYFLWAGFEIWRVVFRGREPPALVEFIEVWRKHVSGAP